jgi:hypothetical protein
MARYSALALLCALLLIAPAHARTTYFLTIFTAVPVEAVAVRVECFGCEGTPRVTVSSSAVTVTWRTPGDRPCYDVRVSGPRLVGRSTDLIACEKTVLPLVQAP